MGLGRGDRLAMAMLDTFDFPAVFWGAIKAGIVPICMNTLLTTESYDYVLRDCQARALIVSEELLERFAPILDDLPDLEYVIVAGGDQGRHTTLEELLATTSGDLVAAETQRASGIGTGRRRRRLIPTVAPSSDWPRTTLFTRRRSCSSRTVSATP